MRYKYLLVLMSLSICLWAQKPEATLKLWSSVALRANIVHKLSVDLSRMYGFSTMPLSLQFTQTSARLQYSPGSHLTLSASWLVSRAERNNGRGLSKYRYSGLIGWRSKFRIWRAANSVKIEFFDSNETRYDKRVIYSFYIRPKNMKISRATKWAPFFNIRFYYNMGGKAITQYDKEGDKIGNFSPEGVHRARFRMGVYFKLYKTLKVTLQAMYQEEFNTIWSLKQNKKINVRNPNTGKITRRFQNYYVLGVSAKMYISPFKIKSAKQNTNQDPELDNL
jgi:hypothetical protein